MAIFVVLVLMDLPCLGTYEVGEFLMTCLDID